MKFLANIFTGLILSMSLVVCVGAQNPSNEGEEINFGYSRNPPIKSAKPARERVITDSAQLSANEKQVEKKTEAALVPDDKTPLAVETKPAAVGVEKPAGEKVERELEPTEIYKVGVGDVLFIGLKDSKSSYFTVLEDGMIDYPLAGGMLKVEGLTVDEIKKILERKVQLFKNPEVSVKVREHASHAIEITGLVVRAGRQYLQREAMPLFVIRAQAIPDTTADLVVITRDGKEDIVINSGEPAYDDTLIYQGDVIEFTSAALREGINGYVYVSGNIQKTGRIGFHEGMTLTQAIVAGGGVEGDNIKKVVIRRKNAEGYLDSKTYKLADIKKGKTVDPILVEGDMIEVGD